MINPYNLPAGNMSRDYLEEWIIFGICVPNKRAGVTAEKVHNFLRSEVKVSPFEKIKGMMRAGCLTTKLQEARLGQYKRIEKALRVVVNLDLTRLSVEMLEGIPGVGPKTARMIILYYDPTVQVVPLDTHILKWLASLGYPVPSSTPSKKQYGKIEQFFRDEAKKRGVTTKTLDEEIWNQYAKKNEELTRRIAFTVGNNS